MSRFTRRSALKAAGVLAAGFAAGLLPIGRALAWNKSAFEAKTTADAMRSLGIANPVESKDIQITAPDVAENGAVVPITVAANVPGTTRIAVFVDKNPFPYVGGFDVSQGAAAFVHLRIKMGETSPVRVVASAGGRHFVAAREVKVTIGGCGG